jgi:hypothetical protein
MSHPNRYVTLYLFVLATMYSVRVLPFGFIHKARHEAFCLKKVGRGPGG